MIYRILCQGREDNPFFLDIWEKSGEPIETSGRALLAKALP